VIGSTADTTGPVQPTGLSWQAGVSVWTKWINSQGGILGHPVQVISLDSKSDPATGTVNMNKLYANPKVVAIVPGADEWGSPAQVDSAKVALVGGFNDDPEWQMSPNMFPSSTTVNEGSGGALGEVGVRTTHNPNGAVIYASDIPSADAIPAIQAGAKKAGGKVVYSAGILESAPNYEAQCLTAQAKHVAWLTVIETAPTIARFMADCAKIGFKPQLVSGYYDGSWLKVPAMQGTQLIDENVPFNSSAPATKQFHAAIAKYDPGLLQQSSYGQYTIQAWGSLQLVAKAIEASKPTGPAITRADVYRGLYSLKNETLGGLTPLLTFARGTGHSVSCYFTAKIDGGQVIPGPSTPTCS
jgi:branched-chain amino acid transport system substrate-binding protein